MKKPAPLPKISDLTLEQKIAQMLLVGFRGLEIKSDNPIINDLKNLQVGGIILFDYDVVEKSYRRNITSPEQLMEFMTQLYSHIQIPTIVSIDQEGGTVNRLKPENGFPETYSHKDLGARDDLSETETHGEKIASILKEYGINTNFAPCVDLGINKENKAIYLRNRTFSEDSDKVTNHARAYIRGHHKQGVLTVLKHFPGHGSSLADTHLGMADVTETWSPDEMKPYEVLISEGMCDMVMSTHIFNGQLDDKYPATLSEKIMKGMLREKLGFEGVIISDDLQMQAITDYFGVEKVIELALLADIDILAFGNNLVFEPDIAERSIAIIMNLIQKGVIDEERINKSVSRIFKLKQKYL